jgi:DtxR family Mn-dependent transcriptional regulator
MAEDGHDDEATFLARCQEPNPASLLEEMEVRGLIQRSAGRIRMTPEGRRRAQELLRRHRLAETLLSSVLLLNPEDVERGACAFEHLLSEEATRRVCTFLGHPKSCPHGRPIPPGDCCRLYEEAPAEPPVVVPLKELKVGQWADVVFMNPGRRKRLARLAHYGLVPRARIRLAQKRPALVVQVGQTEVALDEEIGAEIFVIPRPTAS